MKPFSTKTRKDTQDPLQLDFLSSVHNPIPPMKPIETSPDGTPPLPLLPPTPHMPEADIFASDPFFNSSPTEDNHQTEPFAPLSDIENEQESDAMPFVIEPATPDPEFTAPTAEERLLETIVRETPEKDTSSTTPPSPISDEQYQRLLSERDLALQESRKAGAAHEKALQVIQSFKTRVAALDAELAAAREANTLANQARTQTEIRFTEAEKQWTEKLSHLRHLLDEVEDTRDEVLQKRVPRLLFIGTLAAGIVATLFAYLIGTGQSTPPAISADQPPAPPALFPAPPPAPAPVPDPSEPSVASMPTPLAPVLSPEPEAPPAAPRLVPAPVEPTQTASPRPPKPAVRAPEKISGWPALNGDNWRTTSTPKEMKVVFNYGIFKRGTELSDSAKQDLKAIASLLKGKPLRIEVEGHTDSTKVRKTKTSGADNKSIGLARAKAVASYLSNSCGLPASMLTTTSAGEAHPPYPNTTAASQQKNRTVVFKISAR